MGDVGDGWYRSGIDGDAREWVWVGGDTLGSVIMDGNCWKMRAIVRNYLAWMDNGNMCRGGRE